MQEGVGVFQEDTRLGEHEVSPAARPMPNQAELVPILIPHCHLLGRRMFHIGGQGGLASARHGSRQHIPAGVRDARNTLSIYQYQFERVGIGGKPILVIQHLLATRRRIPAINRDQLLDAVHEHICQAALGTGAVPRPNCMDTAKGNWEFMVASGTKLVPVA